MGDQKRQKTIVIGAGPVGALAALYAGQRGHDVEVYELRGDLRDPGTIPLNFTKSINIALSERGINAIRHSGRSSLLEKVLSKTISMRGRMIHGKKASRELYEQAQDYDVHGRTLFAVDRGEINKILLDDLESMPNVKLFFNHKLTGADFKNKKAWFEIPRSEASSDRRNPEIEKDFDLLIGADGAHSAARYHLMKYTRMDYQQTYIDTLWCEFTITAKDTKPSSSPESKFAISPHHLHIWPGKDFMFIAIPSLDGSFTCTLFLPSTHILALESDPLSLPDFFDHYFPGVTSLIPPATLIQSFQSNPHLPLISIKCSPYHFSSSAVIVGDAAHAMVPFYGQGMNAGLEDVQVLFSILDTHFQPSGLSHSKVIPKLALEKALAEYSAYRTPDAHAINDLALQNYTEMRSSVTSPFYLLRKYLEESISVLFPRLGWTTKYSRVSFGNERYSEVVRRSEEQGKMLVFGLIGGVGVPVLVAGVGLWLKLRRAWAGKLGLGLGLGF